MIGARDGYQSPSTARLNALQILQYFRLVAAIDGLSRLSLPAFQRLQTYPLVQVRETGWTAVPPYAKICQEYSWKARNGAQSAHWLSGSSRV